MNFKRIGFLLGVLILIVLLIQIVNRNERTEGETVGKLISLDQEKIIRLELENKHGTFIFQKRGRHWHIESPKEAMADGDTIEDILDNFSTLVYEREVEKEPLDLQNYGLDSPEIELKFYETESKTPAHIIQIGINSPLDSSAYTKLAENSRIVLIAAYKRDYLERKLFDFREKRFLNFETMDVSAVEYKFQGEKMVFRRNENNWYLEHPLFSLAQDSVLDGIIHDTSRLEAISFLDLPSSEKFNDFGFQSPMLELKIRLKTGIKVLKVIQKNNRFFAFSPDFGELCEIEKSYVENFNKMVSDLREHKIARFYSFDVRRIKYKNNSFHLFIQKDEQGGWKWIKPLLDETIDENRVNDLLSTIEDLEAESFIDQPSGRERFLYYLELEVKGENSQKGGKTIILQFSGPTEHSVTVRNADLPYLFLVSPDIINKLPNKPDQFFEKGKNE